MKFPRMGSLINIFTFWVLLAVLFGSEIFLLPVHAAVITVNSTEDVVEDTGKCTLREAIISANTDTPSGAKDGECTAGSGADIITLAADTFGFTILGSSPPGGGAVHIWILAPGASKT